MSTKSRHLILWALLLLKSSLGAQSWDISLTPGITFPFGPLDSTGKKVYSIGAGAELAAQYLIPAAPILGVQAILGYDYIPTTVQTNLSLVSLGAGLGLAYSPLPIIKLQLAAAGGYGLGLYSGSTGHSAFAQAGAYALFLATPSFGLGAGVTYKNYFGLFHGLGVNLGTAFYLGALRQRARLQIPELRLDPVFPVFYKYYEEHPVGAVILLNEEKGPVSEVKVSLLVPQYMDRPKDCGLIPELKKGERSEIPLFALFTDNLLSVTEGTKVAAELRVDYRFLGNSLTVKQSASLEVYYRNAMTWDDDRKAASFVTAKDPAVLKYAKAVAGLAREQGNKSVNLAFRQALGLFESLSLYGLNYTVDPNSSYEQLSRSDTTLDYLQFPVQTLTYRAGDCDDLSILFAALLESVGIEAAFITVPGHIFTAFSLGLGPEEARRLFPKCDDLLFRESSVWAPVEVTLIQQGFLKAWQEGAREWRDNKAKGEAAFYPIREAWKLYPPTGIVESAAAVSPPESAALTARNRQVLERFVSSQIESEVIRLQEEVRRSNNDPRPCNRLGVLFASFGLLKTAEEQFRAAATKNYVPALVNLGSLLLLKEDNAQALACYNRAYEIDPEGPAVLLGLSKLQFELENHGLAKDFYRKLQARAPELAAKYPYLAMGAAAEGGRAAAADRKEAVEWIEE
jgi:tetratricopeptide (TPR) repeat protein